MRQEVRREARRAASAAAEEELLVHAAVVEVVLGRQRQAREEQREERQAPEEQEQLPEPVVHAQRVQREVGPPTGPPGRPQGRVERALAQAQEEEQPRVLQGAPRLAPVAEVSPELAAEASMAVPELALPGEEAPPVSRKRYDSQACWR